MQAITIRRKTDNSLVCFGPNNGMYDPNYDPSSSVRQIEPDYDTVLKEFQTALASQPVVPSAAQSKIDLALASPAIPQVLKDVLTALRNKV